MATGWANKQTIKEQINGHKNKQMHKQPINQRNNRASKPPSERTETNKKFYTELFSINIKISLDLNSPLGKTWTNNIRKWLNKCNTTWWLNIACFKAHVVLHRAWTQTNTWTIVPIWPIFSQDRAWGGGLIPPALPSRRLSDRTAQIAASAWGVLHPPAHLPHVHSPFIHH